jgi:hypothetical protein
MFRMTMQNIKSGREYGMGLWKIRSENIILNSLKVIVLNNIINSKL